MSQRKSGRGAKAAPTPRRGSSGSTRGVAAQRGRGAAQPAKGDIFTVLLGVALGSMVLGCLFLVIRLSAYEFNISGP